MPLVQRLFSFENFSLFFWGKYLEILKKNFEFFFWFFFKKIYLYIHEQSTSNATWIFRIQRNIETWNKQTNCKFNHDVANQMWSEVKLGRLLLLSPLRMLKTWYAWTLIMMKWLGLTLGRHASCEFLTFDLAHVFMHLWWAQVLGLDPFKKQFWASIPSRIQS